MSRKDDKNRVLQTGESQRKDGTYMFRYMDLCGKRKYIYDRNLTNLRKRKKEILKDLEDGIHIDSSKRTLNEQFDKYMSLKRRIKNTTRTNYTGLWDSRIRNNKLGCMSLSTIKKSDIISFYNSLIDDGLKYSTLLIFNHMLEGCFDLAVSDNLIRVSPMTGCIGIFKVNDAKKKEALTKEEQKRLLDFVQQSGVYSTYYYMLVFMIETCVRCGEMIGLTWQNVDLKNRMITIDHQLMYKKKDGKYQFYADTPKSVASVRQIPLSVTAMTALQEQRKLQLASGHSTNVNIDGYTDFVFSTRNKNPMMPAAVNNVLLNIVNAYNKTHKEALPIISSHILRHTGCTRMAEKGIDTKVLQYIMGHSSVRVTMDVYNHVSYERAAEEIQKLQLHIVG